LFYASTCPHCHELAPVLKHWAEKNHVFVLALSFDNEPLAEFPKFRPATTQWVNAAFAGQAISYPALFVVNRQTQMLYPVSIGSLSERKLNERMRSLIVKIKSFEGGLS